MTAIPKKPPILKGAIVTLRPLNSEKDAPAWHIEMRDPDLWRWTDDIQPKTEADTKDQLEGWAGNPRLIAWAITDNETDRIIGTLRVEPRTDCGRLILADTTHQIARSVWRKGHHREACQLAFDWAFKTLGVEEIRAKAWAPNDRSWRSVESYGFEKLREAHYMNASAGVPMPMRLYLLTKKKWMEMKKGEGKAGG